MTDEQDLILPDSGWHQFSSVHVENGKTTGRGEVPNQRQNLIEFITFTRNILTMNFLHLALIISSSQIIGCL